MARKLQRRAMAPAWSIGVTIPARAIFHLIVVLAMLALFSGHARAGLLGDIGGFIGDVGDWVTGKDSVPGIPSDAACHGYATRATVAQSQNKQLCGFTGDRWGEDHYAHFRWCKMQNTRGEHLLGETAENEERIRDFDLARCTRCNEYENQANSAARQNRVLHCGGTGDRWGSGDGHKTWCMGVRQSTADAETNARTAAVNQCRAKYTPAQLDECKAYANSAVKQAKFNAEQICGGTGHGGRKAGTIISRFALGVGGMTSTEPTSSRRCRMSGTTAMQKTKNARTLLLITAVCAAGPTANQMEISCNLPRRPAQARLEAATKSTPVRPVRAAYPPSTTVIIQSRHCRSQRGLTIQS